MAFYCDPCHKHICLCHHLVAPARSRGACEVCGEIADCVDCHFYDVRQMSDEDRAYLKTKETARIAKIDNAPPKQGDEMGYLEARDKRQHDHFLQWLGSLILDREKEAPGELVELPDDIELLERAFRDGWNVSAALEAQARREAGH